ncbi:ABC transporter substrate-binding protein [Clostridiaceae bacterium M8S5]|nr:ABC transporter substrate-binding protein [Clostridiaceae bacterium M8S5]
MRRILGILVIVFSLTMLFGCKQDGQDKNVTKENKEEIKIVFSGPKAPPTFPLLRMMDTNALGDNVKIEFKVWNGVEELLTIATNSDFGFLAMPVNTAAKLYNKGVDIKLTNVDTWGVMYLASTDSNFKEWKDLKGKKLYIPYKSAPPDIVTQFFLKENGLEVGVDVELVYSTPPQIAQMMKAGKIKYAVNIQPFITASQMGNKDVKVVFDYMKEWKKVNGGEYEIPNAGIVTNKKFLKQNKELVELFESEYEKALNWALENPAEMAKLTEKYLGLNNKLIAKSLPTAGLNYKTSVDSKKDLEKYYELLTKSNKESIGGKTPDENYYYKKK